MREGAKTSRSNMNAGGMSRIMGDLCGQSNTCEDIRDMHSGGIIIEILRTENGSQY